MSESYASAFIEVANMVAPFCIFEEVETIKSFTTTSAKERARVKGHCVIYNLDVEVTTEESEKGLQIVSKYFDNKGNVLLQHKCKYFNFNWSALMEKAERSAE